MVDLESQLLKKNIIRGLGIPLYRMSTKQLLLEVLSVVVDKKLPYRQQKEKAKDINSLYSVICHTDSLPASKQGLFSMERSELTRILWLSL